MIRFLIIAWVLPLIDTKADEVRMARFDVQRVFEQYQHSKDINTVIDRRRSSRLTADEEDAAAVYAAAKRRVDEARAANDHSEVAELQLQLAVAKLDNALLQRKLDNNRREQIVNEELKQWRGELLGEISAAAASLREERGYLLLVPINFPSEAALPAVFAPDRADDLTDKLVARLNHEYAAKKAK